MNNTEDDITQLQLENRELDKRLERIEKGYGCPDCGCFKMIKRPGEIECLGCNGVFVNETKGGMNYGE